jgi:lysophospholipase
MVAKVLVIYSGGTFGMVWNDERRGYDWHTLSSLQTKIKTYPTLYDKDYCITTDEKHCFEPFQPIPLPFVRDSKHRVLYCITEYDPLMDSCNMNMDDWAKLARDIEKHYEQFDGFVILHGTDTMCYTASALSFMLENLGKPVILTGAQVPLSELRSDARDNLLEALIMAGSGHYGIPEVTLYFNNKLLRGNRSIKVNSSSFDAFDSPNIAPLVSVGVEVTIQRGIILKRDSELQLVVHTTMCCDVGILRVFPGITATTIRAFLQPPTRGVVLQTYGAGNVPAEQPVLQALKEACDRGVVVVNCTQCMRGNVTTNYPAARELCELGVVSGADLTVEAALTKLSFLLGQTHLSVHDARKLMARNLCGELTPFTSTL